MDAAELNAIRQLLREELEPVKAEIGSLSSQILKANIRIENDIIPNLRLLAEGHGMLAETLAHKAAVDKLEERVHALEFTVKKVNEELQQLKKAQ